MVQIEMSVISDYKSGLSMLKTARKNNISKRQVGRILKKHKICSRQCHDQNEIDEIAKAIKSGRSRIEICNKFKTTHSWLRNQFGPTPKRSGTGFTKFRNKILKLNSEGLNHKEIANIIGRNWYFVRYVLRACGRTIRRKLPTEIINQIIKMYESGIGSPTIAKQLHINKSTVLNYLKGRIRKYVQPKSENAALRKYLHQKINTMKHTTWEINITIDDLISIYESQNKKCALTSVGMVPYTNRQDSISVDRIDGTIGYIKSNIRLTTRFANLARSSLGDEAFHQFIAQLIKEYAPQETKHDQ